MLLIDVKITNIKRKMFLLNIIIIGRDKNPREAETNACNCNLTQ
jgi:hypothetical protein